MGKYCILVSSCDAYADCWLPFFALLARYWPAPHPAIYLNTETRDFSFPALDVHCPRVGAAAGSALAWSERLIRCLDAIPFDYVLYLQEDYFVHAPVDAPMIGELVDLMQRAEISHIRLVHDDRPGSRSAYRYLSRIDQHARYRVTAQAGLWRVAALRSYLRPHETVWEFEWYGTKRAHRRRDSFFYVNEEYERRHGEAVLPYRGTGVAHGRWVREIVEQLFAAHRISVNFDERGFYDPDTDTWGRRPLLTRAARRLRCSLPW
jgi:hypothetical protein